MTATLLHPRPPSAPGPRGSARWRTRAGGLVLTVSHRSRSVEVHLAGDLDREGAARLGTVLGWLRRGAERTIVIDTRELASLDGAGHAALGAGLARPDGTRDPRVLCVLGPAVARRDRDRALTLT